jgi:hypothetical protein
VAKADEQRWQALFINPRPEDLCNNDVVSEIKLNSDDEEAVRQNNNDGEELDNKNIIDRL